MQEEIEIELAHKTHEKALKFLIDMTNEFDPRVYEADVFIGTIIGTVAMISVAMIDKIASSYKETSYIEIKEFFLDKMLLVEELLMKTKNESLQ